MTVSPHHRPTGWLAVSSALAVVAIAVLWPLQYVGQVCILIYPGPRGCGAEEPRWVPFVGIGLVIALLAAAFVAYFTSDRARTLIIVFAAGVVVVTAIAAGVVALSQGGVWDPPQPLYFD
jgi:hypothetical protein